MSPTEESADDPTAERYREIEYDGTLGTVLVIQDTENDRAWLESDHVVDVEP